jgi:hypothetical protein
MNKEKIIKKLVEYDVDNFDIRDLANLFKYGMTGYDEMSHEELKEHYKNYFEE